MFRFEEDAFLRKGGDYSRNCISPEEELEEAKRLEQEEAKGSRIRIELDAKLKPFDSSAHVLFVSAAGKCTEPLIRAIVNTQSVQWITSEWGDFGQFHFSPNPYHTETNSIYFYSG
jgi:hypothetical protein